MYLNKDIEKTLRKYDLINNNEYDINIEYNNENKNNVLLISENISETMTFILCANELNKLKSANEIYYFYTYDNFIYVANKSAIDENS